MRARCSSARPLTLHPEFYPADPSRGHRMLFAAREQGQDVGAFAHAAPKAVWADELGIADTGVLRELAAKSGLKSASSFAKRGSSLTWRSV